ncbi:beta-class carbonic anhydrase [Gordonibacter urolithinfaciens]|uniref:carbonic anhydrase n=1 Tax=Gordonibacter urolithinfaciens TaxID=1335613 RepID=A0A423UP58_9ACTN|nr:carbonic anhydrase [Gordonibacter urolithinfaciens]MBS6976159.1 carbonic anhydrase [Eggerthellaceae bacterium]MCB6560842.1 carbonic anhydrase [Gordonibacter urolithinfaciens]MCB7084703.1 carbonic anhydrase [Gordonibacter urolithinfaciens]ROT92199.1 carbonic anhydrase [Gordonibacter urolithinfaciens]
MGQEDGTGSGTIDSVLAHNRAFVEGGEFARYATDKYPDKKLAVVSCMDTRLTELLAAALGLKNGDAKIIKVAGAEVAHPFGSVMRSLLIAVCELGVEDIMVVAHTNCGAQHMSGAAMIDSMRRLGVSEQRIEFARHCGIDFDRWLAGFGDTEESVRKSVDLIRKHPVMPPHVRVAGFVMDSVTGELVAVA